MDYLVVNTRKIDNDTKRTGAVAGRDKGQQALLGRGQHYPAEWAGRIVLYWRQGRMFHEGYARREADHRNLRRCISPYWGGMFSGKGGKETRQLL